MCAARVIAPKPFARFSVDGLGHALIAKNYLAAPTLS